MDGVPTGPFLDEDIHSLESLMGRGKSLTDLDVLDGITKGKPSSFKNWCRGMQPAGLIGHSSSGYVGNGQYVTRANRMMSKA